MLPTRGEKHAACEEVGGRHAAYGVRSGGGGKLLLRAGRSMLLLRAEST